MTSAPPPLPRRHSNLLWVLAAVVLFAGLLVSTGIYVFSRFVLRDMLSIRREVRERSMKIQTPAGSLEVTEGGLSDAVTGLPLYPGAQPTGRSGASLSLQIPLQKNMRLVTAEFSTADPFEMVVNYYRQRLGQAAKELRGTNEVSFSIVAGGKQKWVVVRRKGLRTEIAMANVTEAGSQ